MPSHYTLRIGGGGNDPDPGGDEPTPLREETFAGYSSTANFLSDPNGLWDNVESFNTSRISIISSVANQYSNQVMRYTWPNNGSSCSDYQIKPGNFLVPDSRNHIKGKVVLALGDNFKVNSGGSPCAAEYKLLAAGDIGGTGRWNIPEMQAGQFVMGYPGNEAGYTNSDITPSSLWDGEPHEYKFELKLSSSGGGIFRWGIDGELLEEVLGFTSHASHSSINYISPGMNLNQGPNITGMWLDYHRLAVWDGSDYSSFWS